MDARIARQKGGTYLFERASEVHPERALDGAIPHGGQEMMIAIRWLCSGAVG